jgi:UDP-N-acetylmuramoyl-tripeptide--D-alanyl-D-alanine ligase
MSAALWTAAEVAQAVGGRNQGGAWLANGVVTDSRTVTNGDLFVALKGAAQDGHDHVAGALAAGAAAALVSHVPPNVGADANLMVVDDTLAALGRLGRAARARTAAKIAAITGSVGKTGTKEALRLVLADQGATHASVSSYNNHVGVPLSLARMPAGSAYGVFEIGMNHAGEISPLTQMVRPDVAIITTVEAVHVENFPDGGIDGVAAAKAEIFDGAAGGVAVLNHDNRFFEFLSGRARAAGVTRVASFGADREADAHVSSIDEDASGSTVSATIDGVAIIYRVGAPGRHWAFNSLAVLLAVDCLGADVGRAAAALAGFSPPKGRGARLTVLRDDGSFVLIDDSYNASPPSMKAAFAVLSASKTGSGGRRIAVLGDMLELGPESPRLHADLARPLIEAHIDQVFCCGSNMRLLHDALPAAMRGEHAADSRALLPFVNAAVRSGDVVLVKGSLGSRMGLIVDALRGAAAPPAQKN